MTREEAIEYLKRADTTVGQTIKTRTAEALEMAIKALEQEAVVTIPEIPKDYKYDTETKDFLVYRNMYTGKEIHIERPTPVYKLEQEPCEDCISRKEVEKLVYRFLQKSTDENSAFYEHLLDLPPVTPQEPKTGHWKLIQRGKFVDICCSECGHIRVKDFAYNYNAKDVYNSLQYEEFMKTSHLNFCENCGEKMVEPKESEE